MFQCICQHSEMSANKKQCFRHVNCMLASNDIHSQKGGNVLSRSLVVCQRAADMSDWQKTFADTVSCLPAFCNENTGNEKIPRREKNDLKDTN